MVNRSKAKGTAAESAVVLYWKAKDFVFCERRTLSGANDKGDLAGLPNLAGEVKNCKRLDLAGWVDEANVEAANAGVDWGIVIHKRPGKADPAHWYVTLSLQTFVQIYRLAVRAWTSQKSR